MMTSHTEEQQRRPDVVAAAAFATSEEQSPMALNTHTSPNNGFDRSTMPPTDNLFPRTQHEAELEWDIAKRILFPLAKAAAFFVCGALALAISNGVLVGPWKSDLATITTAQNLAMQKLEIEQRALSEKIAAHGNVLDRLDIFASDMRAAVGRIEGRISPLAQVIQPPIATSGSPPLPIVKARNSKPKAKLPEGWSASPR